MLFAGSRSHLWFHSVLRPLKLIKASSATLGCHVVGSRHWVSLVKEGGTSVVTGSSLQGDWLASPPGGHFLFRVWIWKAKCFRGWPQQHGLCPGSLSRGSWSCWPQPEKCCSCRGTWCKVEPVRHDSSQSLKRKTKKMATTKMEREGLAGWVQSSWWMPGIPTCRAG